MCIHRTGNMSQHINDRCALAEVVFDESTHVRSPSGGSQIAALHIGCRYACTLRHNACVLAFDIDMEQGRKSASVAAALAAARRKGAAISFPADTVVQLRSLLKACISKTPAFGCEQLQISNPEVSHVTVDAVQLHVPFLHPALRLQTGLRRMLWAATWLLCL